MSDLTRLVNIQYGKRCKITHKGSLAEKGNLPDSTEMATEKDVACSCNPI